MLNAGIILSTEREQQICKGFPEIEGIKWNTLFFTDQTLVDNQAGTIPIVSSCETLPYINDILFVLDKSLCNYDFLSKSIRNCCHLFIEETNSLSEQELRQLSILASEAGTGIQVRNDLLHQPLVEKSLSLLNATRLLDIRQLSENPTQNIIGLLYQNLSFVRKLKGFSLQKIDITGLAGLSENPEMLNIRLEFTNGTVIILTISTICSKPQYNFTFFGDKMTAVADFISNSFVSNKDSEEKIAQVDTEKCLLRQIENFTKNITSKPKPTIDLEEELEVHKLIKIVTEKLKLRTSKV
jgi:hypothetical protein